MRTQNQGLQVVAIRRIIIAKKLWRQCMLDSVDDDLEGPVLHKMVINCLRKCRVSTVEREVVARGGGVKERAGTNLVRI